MCNLLSLTEDVVDLYLSILSPDGNVTLNQSGNLLDSLFASTCFSDGLCLIMLSLTKLFLEGLLGACPYDVIMWLSFML